MIALFLSFLFGFKAVEIGDSNCNGTVRDTVWSSLVGGVWVGDPVQSGFVYRRAGTNYTVYPATNTPTPGKAPYLIDLAIADGDTSGYYATRCTNGSDTRHGVNSPLTLNWNGLKADVAAIGQGPPELVVVDLGANDSNDAVEAALYEGNMEWLIDEIINEWGTSEIVIVRESCSNAAAVSTYPELRTTIYTAQNNLTVTYPNVRIANALTLCDRYDAIHLSTGGHGGGQECVAVDLY